MKLAVIGGGAAGFFAAIHGAQRGLETVILEKSNKILAKVKVSGGGRCNVTNVVTDPTLLVKNYPRGHRGELRGPFTKFSTIDTVNWFELKGVKIKAEADGRMFPVTDSSQTIIDCLVAESKMNNIKIHTGSTVTKIERSENGFLLELDSTLSLYFDYVIVATGGSPNLSSYSWLVNLGHTIIPPVPSLFTFNIPDSPFIKIMGVSVQDVKIKILNSAFEENGPLLFTHWGISGPAVLKLSAWGARWLAENGYNFSISINFIPPFNEEQVYEKLMEHSFQNKLKKVCNTSQFNIPSRLWELLCKRTSIDEHKRWSETSKASLRKLSQQLVACQLNVKGKTTFKEEFVTCGGVDLKEVNMKTMESKLIPGLYFAGEILNIDGVTGGFNFQAAWTTGFIAGSSIKV
ncbi:MAG: NAD(P)/FAD-dependent oxidoreductase [Bacteroidetes bacterium]|nr:NAD(P)/FAD-dependent oxidoreductase [Bacteroidota bacterium]